MPSQSSNTCYNDYLSTLGEVEGFLDSQSFDYVAIVGDFNVDFARGGPLVNLLDDFASDLELVVCDLSYKDDIMFTYERDDGLVRSWIDHIVVSISFTPHITNVYSLKSGCFESHKRNQQKG